MSERIKSWQFRWAIFFQCFNFCLSFRLGTQNNKAVALSRIHGPMNTEKFKLILPSSVHLETTVIELEKQMTESNKGNPTPARPAKMYLF